MDIGEIAIVTSRPFPLTKNNIENGREVTIGENIQKSKKFTMYFFQLQQKEYIHIIFTITTELYKQNLDIVKTATFRKSFFTPMRSLDQAFDILCLYYGGLSPVQD